MNLYPECHSLPGLHPVDDFSQRGLEVVGILVDHFPPTLHLLALLLIACPII